MHGIVFSFMRPQPIMRIGGLALTFTGFFALIWLAISVLQANLCQQLSIVALWSSRSVQMQRQLFAAFVDFTAPPLVLRQKEGIIEENERIWAVNSFMLFQCIKKFRNICSNDSSSLSYRNNKSQRSAAQVFHFRKLQPSYFES